MRWCMPSQQCRVDMVSQGTFRQSAFIADQGSDGQAPYCATYQYAQASQGYGCAAVKGYNKTVLTSPTDAVTPFGQSASTTSSSGTTPASSQLTDSTITAAPSPSSSPANLTLISGGAIAGTVAGSILALAAIVGIFVFFLRRHRIKKEQERQAATVMSERAQQEYVYAQYAKTDGSTLSPPMSPSMHSRHPSDQNVGFASSPPVSDNDRPWSPETVILRTGPAELGVEDEPRYSQKR